jgi:hypothetical protein
MTKAPNQHSKTQKEARARRIAAAKATPKRKPKQELAPYPFTKLEQVTYAQLKRFQPCPEGLTWWDKTFGKGKPMNLDVEEVPKWFKGTFTSVITFDPRWASWLLAKLMANMIDQMNLNHPRYRQECLRLQKIHRVFKNEATKAERDNRLSLVVMGTRMDAAIVICQTMIVTYKKM